MSNVIPCLAYKPDAISAIDERVAGLGVLPGYAPFSDVYDVISKGTPCSEAHQ